jgi:hypothetical protein
MCVSDAELVLNILTAWQWIPVYLTPTYKLSVSQKEKGCMYVDDLHLCIHWHWVRDTHVYPHERFRVQLPFLMLCSGFTTTRPGALVKVLYKHVTLTLIRDEDRQSTLVMTLLLEETKRSGGVSEP